MVSKSTSCSLYAHAWRATLRYGQLVGHELGMLCRGGYARPLRRAGVDLWLLPGIGVLQLVNWCCLWMDELLFPKARRVELRRPVFIVGPPRSGTTHLHRAMAADRSRFSTASTWEVFLAPSILQKKLLRGLRSLDARLGRPLARTVRWSEARLLGGFGEMHPSSLAKPEEDYFYLSCVHACTGWALAFPGWRPLQDLMTGETGDTKRIREQALDFYRRCLRKQLYVDGADRRLLCKNASFSSWMDLLPEMFPDAKFVVCMRTASETVPSMLSTADQAMEGLAATPAASGMHERLIESMQAHYHVLAEAADRLPAERVAVVHIEDLKSALPEVLRRLSQFVGGEFSDSFQERMGDMGRRSRRHRSRHRYSPEDYRLDPEALERTCPELPPTMGGVH